jgi:predicted Zn-dependent protease
MRMRLAWTAAIAVVLAAAPAAQLGRLGGQAGKLGQTKEALRKTNKAFQELKFTEAEEQQLGADVSARLRDKYGVVQDVAVHRYVTLVGSVLAQDSSRADLHWTFIVLDTDGVNAFAAPGGFVHITRGALALMRNESELGGVLAHEIGHVMARHTIRAIQKSKVEGALADAATRTAFLEQVGNRLYAATLENAFDRGDEMESDRIGVALANHAGYSPEGLGGFLARLADRNKALTDRSGMFASHPETQARLDQLAKVIRSQHLSSTATAQARYAEAVSYTPVAVGEIAQAAPASGAADQPAASASRGGSGKFGLGGLGPLGSEKSSSSTIASAGSRGVNPDRDARGGPNKSLVVVALTVAEIVEFRAGIAAG